MLTYADMQVDLRVLEFAVYGKNWIVDQKMSPDALVQLAFQAPPHTNIYNIYLSIYLSIYILC
jgi:hypothetical protein